MMSNSMQIVEPQGRRLRGSNGLHFISSLKIRKHVLHGDEWKGMESLKPMADIAGRKHLTV